MPDSVKRSNQVRHRRCMALADSLFITGKYEMGPILTTLMDILTNEAADAWSRVLCRMGMEDIPLRASFEAEMAIVRKAYHLRMFGARDFQPAVFPGWTTQNTLLFCFELLNMLLQRMEGVTDYTRMSRTFDYYIRVVGTLAPLLPQRTMGFDISAPHAVLFVLESTSDSFIYKKHWSSSVQEGGFCKIHAIFMNVLAMRLMRASKPSLEAINDPTTAFGHFAGSNPLVCTLTRLDREFTGLLSRENKGDHKHTKYLASLMGHCMKMAIENVKRLTVESNAALACMIGNPTHGKSTIDADHGLNRVLQMFKHRMYEPKAPHTGNTVNRKRRLPEIGSGGEPCISQPDFSVFDTEATRRYKQRRVAA